MKFVIHKGLEGFADRLQTLLAVIKYSIKTNRILVIDWTDYEWCNNDEQDFYHYFHFENLKYMSLKDFKLLYSIFQKNNINISTYPNIWHNNLFYKYTDYPKEKFHLLENNGIIENISNKIIQDYTQDIIVYINQGYRSFDYSLFNKHIRLNKIVIDKIYNTNFYKNIIAKKIEYTCVHFRLGDRQVNGKLSNNSLDKIKYIKKLESKINFNIKNILLISDNNSIIELFKTRNANKNIIIHTTNNYKGLPNEDKIGLHKLKTTDKEKMNIEMLIDFYLFSKANYKVNDGISLFSSMSSHISFSM